MRGGDLLPYVFDTVFRMFPHRVPTGLQRIGDPGRDAPVLVTGNYALTVRRIKEILRGRDVWLLVANSDGVNVWCAAGGGEFTHHDVISVVRTSRVEEQVDHREIVLPQLAATGIEKARIDEIGWTVKWGPARFEDLPGFLDRGLRVKKPERKVTFPLWERLELSVMWFLWLAVVALVVLGFAWSWLLGGVAAVSIGLAVIGMFVLLPRLRVTGKLRWLTFGAAAGVGTLVGAGLLVAAGAFAAAPVGILGATCLGAMLLLSIDITGTTPWYASGVNVHATPRVDLEVDKCTGQAECVLVCPVDVLEMQGSKRKVAVVRGEDCVACGACIVQCPEDALRFKFPDGTVVEPQTVRRTKLNMLGQRKVEVPEKA